MRLPENSAKRIVCVIARFRRFGWGARVSRQMWRVLFQPLQVEHLGFDRFFGRPRLRQAFECARFVCAGMLGLLVVVVATKTCDKEHGVLLGLRRRTRTKSRFFLASRAWVGPWSWLRSRWIVFFLGTFRYHITENILNKLTWCYLQIKFRNKKSSHLSGLMSPRSLRNLSFTILRSRRDFLPFKLIKNI